MATTEGVKDPNEWVTNDEIPECLKKLTKLIIRAFYSIEHSLGKFNRFTAQLNLYLKIFDNNFMSNSQSTM